MTNKNYTIIIGLIALNSLMFLYGFIMVDSARDISQAKDIADGVNFPLLGPDIGGFAHIGPVWFYFLAIPALSGSLLVLSLWVGLFSSLKIILVYWLGDKLMGNPLNIFQRLPNFIITLFYYGPLQIRNFIAMWSQIVGNVIFGIYLITLLFGALGIVKFALNNKSNFTHVMKALMVFLALCLMLLSLRSFIPFYMMLVLVPFMTFMLAFGLKQFLDCLKIEYFYAMIVLFFLINLIPLVALTIQAQNKQFSLPNLSNIELPSDFSKIDLSNSLDGISVLNSKYLSPLLCNDIYVHGPFSIVLDYNSAIPVSFT